MKGLLLKIAVFLTAWKTNDAALPCNEIHKDLSVPCMCDVKPASFLEQGVGILMDCDRIVFSEDLPLLPLRAPIIEFRHRYSGHQTLPSEVFSTSSLPLQKLDFSHNLLRRLSERMFTSVADTIEVINLSDNLLGDNLNPIFATTEFQNLENLRELDLSGNRIRGLEEGILRGCTNLQELKLDRNLLAEIPRQSIKGPKALGKLSLAENEMKTIKRNDFSAQKDLKILNLKQNDLTSIEGGTFLGMTKLREISLSENSFSRLNSDVFLGAENLEVLDLSLNYFTEFPYITLKSIPNLKHLNLSSNLIKTLENANLGSLTNLETLDFARNNIANIQRGTFLGLKKLKHLDLSVNSVRTIEDYAFEGLDNLEQLSLKDNNILLIPASALGRLPKLVHLDISYNRISAISRDILQSLAKELVHFNLAWNLVREIPEGTFQDFKDLKILNLNGNLLSKVNGHTFLGLEDTLEYLYLAHNKINSFLGSPLSLPKLLHLDLSENTFEDIPWTQFSQLPNLRYLYLSRNPGLEFLDSAFFENSTLLTTLDVSYCGIKGIHSEWSAHLSNLMQLILSGNSLEGIPENSFTNFKYLTYLDLSFNRIKNMKADFLSIMPNLRTLLLNGNRLNGFKGEYSRTRRANLLKSTNLEHLNIANNEISTLIPTSFKFNRKLRTLIAHNNRFNIAPADSIANLQFLEKIDLSKNYLKKIDELDFSKLPKLRELNVSGNEISYVSESAFHKSPQLQTIDLSKNQINRLGERTFEGVKRIKYLDLHENLLEELPEMIFEPSKLRALENINLSKNKFENPPLKALQKQYFSLDSVDVSKNNIKEIPSEDVTMVNAKKLDLSFNPLTGKSISNILGDPKTAREVKLAGVGIDKLTQLQMPFLQKLDVSKNSLSAIDSKVFKRTTLLEQLNISQNKVQNLSDIQIGPTVKALKSLDISGNPIKEIVGDQLSGMKSLTTLHMHDLFETTKIEKNAFKTLENIKEMKAFGYPRLGYLDVPGILKHVPKSQKLYMEMKDSIVDSEKLHYIMHPRMKSLGLHGDQIKSVSSGAFAGLKAPKMDLKLVNTSVYSLSPNMFYSLPKSSEITFDLTGSKISFLTVEFTNMLDENKNHVVLNGLDTNPIVCDCKAKPLRKWSIKNNINITCHNGELAGRFLRDVPLKDLICIDTKTTKRYTSTAKNGPITKNPKTELDMMWSFNPQIRKTTFKPPEIITANHASLNNDDVLIIGIVGGVVAFIIILIIVICIIRLRMLNDQCNSMATPYTSRRFLYSTKSGHPSLYMTSTYGTLPHKVAAHKRKGSSVKHYVKVRRPTQMQSYHQNSLQNQSAYYIPYAPDEKIEYR